MSPDTPCPSTEILRRSLDPDDPMPEPERQRIEAHVDQCDKRCKEVIETLLRGNTLAAGPETTRPVEAVSVSAPERPAPSLPGYEILEEIGRGGMGVVYKARDVGLNRLVAVKMMLAGAYAADDDLARFRTEAEAVAALRHANVVQIYEIGEQDGRPYFSLEYVEGGSLAQKLAGTPQPPAQAAALIETLARAVHFAHQQGVIHRDLKPANVLLASDGAPKIADFGLAKRLEADAGHTKTGQIVGTPGYMAPEQATPGSAPIGTPADVYALGAILYEMLTGRPPFQAKTPWDVLMLVVSADPTPPRRLRPKTPADLETICLKCLQKEPQRRYGSAEALAEDLRRFLTNRPIEARRVGVLERAVKWVRRNAVVSALAAVVLVATAAGVGGWWWAVQDRATRQAEADRLNAARLSRAEGAASAALARATEEGERAAAVERDADDRGREEPETPETAKQVADLRRQAAAAVDEAERALGDALGTEAARTRTGERRRAVEAELDRAEKDAALLGDLDRARSARAGTKADSLDTDLVASLYASALSDYGLDLSRPEGETAARIRESRPGLRLALVLALDDWASCVRDKDAAQVQRLNRIADGADDDDWRRRWRRAQGDLDALKALAEEAPALRLPAASLILLERDLRSRGARPEAAALLRAARRRRPGDFWIYFDLQLCLHDLNHPDPATLNEAEACACAAAALRPGSSAAYQSLGNVLEDQGDLTGAAESYQKAIDRDPTFAYAYINLGNVLSREGDLTKAAERLRKAVELGPDYAVGHYNLGLVLAKQDDLTGAAACFRRVIQLDRKDAGAQHILGVVLDEQNKPAGAIACYRKAIELDPKDASVQCDLGAVLAKQGDRRHAADAYQKAIALNPRFALALSNLGALLDEQNDLAGAAACLRRAVAINPRNVAIRLRLGHVLRRGGDPAGAAACYRMAIELNPRNPDAYYFLGLTRDAQDDLAGAAAAYQKAVDLDPRDGEAHYHLGLVLEDQGEFAKAGTHLRRCLILFPADDSLRSRAWDSLRRCQRFLALQAKLDLVLAGEQQPGDDDERLDLADVSERLHRYAAAAGFSRDAFADDRRLADNLQSGDRYAAACSAARAGCGQGEDAKDLDDRARAGWRKQALAWLRADLRLWSKRLASGAAADPKAVAETLRSWGTDAALACVRDPAELAKLPPDEQEAWRQFWMDVQSILDKAGEKK